MAKKKDMLGSAAQRVTKKEKKDDVATGTLQRRAADRRDLET